MNFTNKVFKLQTKNLFKKMPTNSLKNSRLTKLHLTLLTMSNIKGIQEINIEDSGMSCNGSSCASCHMKCGNTNGRIQQNLVNCLPMNYPMFRNYYPQMNYNNTFCMNIRMPMNQKIRNGIQMKYYPSSE